MSLGRAHAAIWFKWDRIVCALYRVRGDHVTWKFQRDPRYDRKLRRRLELEIEFFQELQHGESMRWQERRWRKRVADFEATAQAAKELLSK